MCTQCYTGTNLSYGMDKVSYLYHLNWKVFNWRFLTSESACYLSFDALSCCCKNFGLAVKALKSNSVVHDGNQNSQSHGMCDVSYLSNFYCIIDLLKFFLKLHVWIFDILYLLRNLLLNFCDLLYLHEKCLKWLEMPISQIFVMVGHAAQGEPVRFMYLCIYQLNHLIDYFLEMWYLKRVSDWLSFDTSERNICHLFQRGKMWIVFTLTWCLSVIIFLIAWMDCDRQKSQAIEL